MMFLDAKIRNIPNFRLMPFTASTDGYPVVLTASRAYQLDAQPAGGEGFPSIHSIDLRNDLRPSIDQGDYQNGQLQFDTLIDIDSSGFQDRPEFGFADGFPRRYVLGELVELSNSFRVLKRHIIEYEYQSLQIRSGIYRISRNSSNRPIRMVPAKPPIISLQNNTINLGIHSGIFETFDKNFSGNIADPFNGFSGNWSGASTIAAAPFSAAGTFNGTMPAESLAFNGTATSNQATTASMRFNPGSFRLESGNVSLELVQTTSPPGYSFTGNESVLSQLPTETSFLTLYLYPYISCNVNIAVYKLGVFGQEYNYPIQT